MKRQMKCLLSTSAVAVVGIVGCAGEAPDSGPPPGFTFTASQATTEATGVMYYELGGTAEVAAISGFNGNGDRVLAVSMDSSHQSVDYLLAGEPINLTFSPTSDGIEIRSGANVALVTNAPGGMPAVFGDLGSSGRAVPHLALFSEDWKAAGDSLPYKRGCFSCVMLGISMAVACAAAVGEAGLNLVADLACITMGAEFFDECGGACR